MRTRPRSLLASRGPFLPPLPHRNAVSDSAVRRTCVIPDAESHVKNRGNGSLFLSMRACLCVCVWKGKKRMWYWTGVTVCA